MPRLHPRRPVRGRGCIRGGRGRGRRCIHGGRGRDRAGTAIFVAAVTTRLSSAAAAVNGHSGTAGAAARVHTRRPHGGNQKSTASPSVAGEATLNTVGPRPKTDLSCVWQWQWQWHWQWHWHWQRVRAADSNLESSKARRESRTDGDGVIVSLLSALPPFIIRVSLMGSETCSRRNMPPFTTSFSADILPFSLCPSNCD